MAINNTLTRLAVLAVALCAVYPAQGAGAPTGETSQQSAAEEAAQTFKGNSGLRVDPHPQGEVVGMLGRLYEQRLLIKARVELLNTQAQLKTKDATTAKIAQSYAPTVKMVQGVGDSLFATFLYPGNMTMDARVGDTISGGYKVLAISINQVVLSKDGERIRLGFSASPPIPLLPMDSAGGQSTTIPGHVSGISHL
jgi:hypothetical protein